MLRQGGGVIRQEEKAMNVEYGLTTPDRSRTRGARAYTLEVWVDADPTAECRPGRPQ